MGHPSYIPGHIYHIPKSGSITSMYQIFDIIEKQPIPERSNSTMYFIAEGYRTLANLYIDRNFGEGVIRVNQMACNMFADFINDGLLIPKATAPVFKEHRSEYPPALNPDDTKYSDMMAKWIKRYRTKFAASKLSSIDSVRFCPDDCSAVDTQELKFGYMMCGQSHDGKFAYAVNWYDAYVIGLPLYCTTVEIMPDGSLAYRCGLIELSQVDTLFKDMPHTIYCCASPDDCADSFIPLVLSDKHNNSLYINVPISLSR